MVVYCSAFGCSNAVGDSSRFRHFLRFHKVPKDVKQHNVWAERVRRRRAHFTAKMVICSDHFFDECYETSAFLKSKLMPHEKRLQIPSTPDALPNTDPSFNEFREPFSAEVGGRPQKRRRDFSYIDIIISDNDSIISTAQGATDSTSASTDFNASDQKEIGTQCSRNVKNTYTQTGKSHVFPNAEPIKSESGSLEIETIDQDSEFTESHNTVALYCSGPQQI